MVSSSERMPSSSSCMTSAAVNSFVMLPMWNAAAGSRASPGSPSPLAVATTSPSPRDAPTAVPGIV
jgi:hypothetical protein